MPPTAVHKYEALAEKYEDRRDVQISVKNHKVGRPTYLSMDK